MINQRDRHGQVIAHADPLQKLSKREVLSMLMFGMLNVM